MPPIYTSEAMLHVALGSGTGLYGLTVIMFMRREIISVPTNVSLQLAYTLIYTFTRPPLFNILLLKPFSSLNLQILQNPQTLFLMLIFLFLQYVCLMSDQISPLTFMTL